MRAQPEDICKAQSTPLGALCAGCTSTCAVNRLTKLGNRYGFQVYFMPGDLRVFSTPGLASTGQALRNVGLIGVSCVLTNAPGGWDVHEMGIAAQGVMLDYCGCSWHWDKDGLPTDLSSTRLLKILGIGSQNHI
jgi:hypothetical protein